MIHYKTWIFVFFILYWSIDFYYVSSNAYWSWSRRTGCILTQTIFNRTEPSVSIYYTDENIDQNKLFETKLVSNDYYYLESIQFQLPLYHPDETYCFSFFGKPTLYINQYSFRSFWWLDWFYKPLYWSICWIILSHLVHQGLINDTNPDQRATKTGLICIHFLLLSSVYQEMSLLVQAGLAFLKVFFANRLVPLSRDKQIKLFTQIIGLLTLYKWIGPVYYCPLWILYML